MGFIFVCCFVFVLLLPGLLFLFTYIFRQSCALSGLEKPSILAATGHLFLITVAQFFADLVMVELVRWGCSAAGIPRWDSRSIS